jgi:hypothetical protein
MTQTVQNVAVQFVLNREEVFAKVDRGIELHRSIEAQTNELEEIKAYLREAAATGAFPATDTGTVEIRSPETENCVQVVSCKDTPVLIAGKDLTALKSQLTAGDFNLMFRETITMQPTANFEKAFNVATKKVKGIVRKFVGWRPNSNQVRFSK